MWWHTFRCKGEIPHLHGSLEYGGQNREKCHLLHIPQTKRAN